MHFRNTSWPWVNLGVRTSTWQSISLRCDRVLAQARNTNSHVILHISAHLDRNYQVLPKYDFLRSPHRAWPVRVYIVAYHRWNLNLHIPGNGTWPCVGIRPHDHHYRYPDPVHNKYLDNFCMSITSKNKALFPCNFNTIAGVDGNQDLVWCVTIGVNMVFGVHRRFWLLWPPVMSTPYVWSPRYLCEAGSYTRCPTWWYHAFMLQDLAQTWRKYSASLADVYCE